LKRIIAMLKDESGAVTVDWVVLTTAAIAIAMLMYQVLASPISDMAQYIADTVVSYESFFD
jgi:Flp pilus assembly pilin Flp